MKPSGDKLIERLRELAEKATAGEWRAEYVAGMGFGEGAPLIASDRPGEHLAWMTRGGGGDANAAYIAAANPQAILALLTALAAAEEDLAGSRANTEVAWIHRDHWKARALAAESEAASWKALAGKAHLDLVVAREALMDVVIPLGKVRRDAQARGHRLSGQAYSIANSLAFVQDIARAALSLLPEVEGG